MSTSISSLLLFLTITLAILVPPFTSVLVFGHADTKATKKSFRVELSHRDYGKNLNNYELLRRAIQREKDRLQRLHAMMTSTTNAINASAPIAAGSGEYVMYWSIGNPSQPCKVIVDTGSDLIWTQCQPCIVCFNQAPYSIYNPKVSSTNTPLSCTNPYCLDLPNYSCGSGGKCTYLYQYGDGSSTSGTLSTETISLGKPTSTVSFSNIAYGCANNNQGTFADACGLFGMGRGPLSFPSQVRLSRFSYCLVTFRSSANSTMYFGSTPAVSGPSATSPLLVNSLYSTFYYIYITAIKFGETTLPISSTDFLFSDKTGTGGVISDSGTTLTYFPANVVTELSGSMIAQIKQPSVSQSDSGLGPCWLKSTSYQYPTLVITFKGGQSWTLYSQNYLVEDTYTFFFFKKYTVLCSIFQATGTGNPSIIGNIMQSDHQVVYDLDKQTVTFIQTDCSKLS